MFWNNALQTTCSLKRYNLLIWAGANLNRVIVLAYQTVLVRLFSQNNTKIENYKLGTLKQTLLILWPKSYVYIHYCTSQSLWFHNQLTSWGLWLVLWKLCKKGVSFWRKSMKTRHNWRKQSVSEQLWQRDHLLIISRGCRGENTWIDTLNHQYESYCMVVWMVVIGGSALNPTFYCLITTESIISSVMLGFILGWVTIRTPSYTM